jgi:hypothetical protein
VQEIAEIELLPFLATPPRVCAVPQVPGFLAAADDPWPLKPLAATSPAAASTARTQGRDLPAIAHLQHPLPVCSKPCLTDARTGPAVDGRPARIASVAPGESATR